MSNATFNQVQNYNQYFKEPNNLKTKFEKFADFDVLSNDPKTTVEIVKERLNDNGIKNIKIINHSAVGEIVPEHYELKVGKDTILFINIK